MAMRPNLSNAFKSIEVRASRLTGVNGRDGSLNDARASANTSAIRPRARALLAPSIVVVQLVSTTRTTKTCVILPELSVRVVSFVHEGALRFRMPARYTAVR